MAICTACKSTRLIFSIILPQPFFFTNVRFQGTWHVPETHLHFIISKSLTTVTNARLTSSPIKRRLAAPATASLVAGRGTFRHGHGEKGPVEGSRSNLRVSHERLRVVCVHGDQPSASCQCPAHWGWKTVGVRVHVGLLGYSQSPHPTGPSEQDAYL